MSSYIRKHAIILKKEAEERENERLKASTIEKIEHLPAFHYTIPDEGMLISTGDIKDIHYLNLKELIDPTKNIYYYNSCICKYKEGYRLFYRCGKNPKTCEDRIATCLLTKDLQVVTDSNKYVNVFSNWKASRDAGPDTLSRHIRYTYPNKQVKSFIYKDGLHVEDPRAVEFQGSWFLLYTDGLTIGVAKLDLDTCDVIYSHFLNIPPSDIISKQSDGREKNWIPVVSNNNMYILYSDTPRTFIHCIDDQTSLKIVKYDTFNFHVEWKYGPVRGGCPPIEYDKNTLIWFFHSAKNVYSSIPAVGVKTYFIGAYLTSKKYPFEIKQITKFPILFGYTSPIRPGFFYQTNVIFPCGAVSVGNDFLISMGINDYCIGHLKVYRNDIIWKVFVEKIVEPNKTS